MGACYSTRNVLTIRRTKVVLFEMFEQTVSSPDVDTSDFWIWSSELNRWVMLYGEVLVVGLCDMQYSGPHAVLCFPTENSISSSAEGGFEDLLAD